MHIKHSPFVFGLLLGGLTLFGSAPLVSANELPPRDFGTHIVCRIFNKLNDVGSPLPSLNDTSCPPSGGDMGGGTGGTTTPPTGGGGGTGTSTPPVIPPAGGGGGSSTGTTTATSTPPTVYGGGGGSMSTVSSGNGLEGSSTSTGTGSGGGGSSFGGLVLGTSTEAVASSACGIYLTSYLRINRSNDKNEVLKLQMFLNQHDGEHVPLTGFFGPLTFAAVERFQVRQWESVLKPWVSFGLPTDHMPTGYVYKTTERQINQLMCPTLDLPMPILP